MSAPADRPGGDLGGRLDRRGHDLDLVDRPDLDKSASRRADHERALRLCEAPALHRCGALVLPWIGFLFNTWLGALIGVAMYIGSRIFAPAEEVSLSATFGAKWDEYCSSVRFPSL